jgi:hypothetical protein
VTVLTDASNGALNALESHAMAAGVFEKVNRHEVKNVPGSGLTAEIWCDRIDPVAARSGLAATSVRLVFKVRIGINMLSEPQDAIDPAVIAAVDVLLTAYSADFDFGGTVSNVDLLGAHGIGLGAQAGYLQRGQTLARVMDINVPLIINDAFTQAA